MNLPKSVKLREVVTRDGFQSINKFIPTQTKIELIDKILDSGIKEIEATSFVNPKNIPQLSDASELVSSLSTNNNNVTYSALVPNLQGAKQAINVGIKKLIVVISASNSHNKANIGKSIDQSLHELSSIFQLAKDNNVSITGSVAVAFGCPYENRVKIATVSRIVEKYLSLGASSLILADTIGIANPTSVSKLLNYFKNIFLDNILTLHFHNNFGTAMANLLAAMDAGISSFDTSLGGIGGCPYVPMAAGNLPTEDVVNMLNNMNISTEVNLEKIIFAATFLEKILGYKLPSQLLRNIDL